MPLLPFKPPPGMRANTTEYGTSGGWRDGSLVRWRNGNLQPVGGWQKAVTPTALSGVPRAILPWWSQDQLDRYLAIGTNEKLYVYVGGSMSDVTPTGFSAGRATSLYGLGYGAESYGMEAYGTARTSSSLILDAATWSLDAWGNELLALMAGDGTLYQWDPAAPAAATAVTNAPTASTAVFVSDEAHAVLLGASGNARRVHWSARRDLTTWTPSSTNNAGFFDLVTPGRIVTGRRGRGEALIFTDMDVHSMAFEGSPVNYGFQQVGNNCGVIGPNAVIGVNGQFFWMGDGDFFVYDGFARVLDSTVHKRVFQDLNVLQGAKITAGHNAEFGEVWWFYPSAASLENDRYVVFNYRDGIWYTGELSRTAWADRGILKHPTAATADGFLWEHENGWTDNGASRVGKVWAEAAGLSGGYGDNTVRLSAIIPDIEEGGDFATVTFRGRYQPLGAEYTVGPFGLDNGTGRVPIRAVARQYVVRVDAAKDGRFSLGTFRLEAEKGSRR